MKEVSGRVDNNAAVMAAAPAPPPLDESMTSWQRAPPGAAGEQYVLPGASPRVTRVTGVTESHEGHEGHGGHGGHEGHGGLGSSERETKAVSPCQDAALSQKAAALQTLQRHAAFVLAEVDPAEGRPAPPAPPQRGGGAAPPQRGGGAAPPQRAARLHRHLLRGEEEDWHLLRGEEERHLLRGEEERCRSASPHCGGLQRMLEVAAREAEHYEPHSMQTSDGDATSV
ncbi:hypothetical protein EYF80_061470 [Liparis tanakae]|uniref:Uncharacterized protein n=1 Tax=Liparis tanakae TaxID=230148 RepID=A0A4Z2EHT5_9TELE|nr:hypothetical protein EYF80_061470 [Liparis tanakae]